MYKTEEANMPFHFPHFLPYSLPAGAVNTTESKTETQRDAPQGCGPIRVFHCTFHFDSLHFPLSKGKAGQGVRVLRIAFISRDYFDIERKYGFVRKRVGGHHLRLSGNIAEVRSHPVCNQKPQRQEEV